MPIGDPYLALAEAKGYVKIDDAIDDGNLQDALNSVSTEINDICGRQFHNSGGVVSSRVFEPLTPNVVHVDDFHSTTGLIVAVDLDDDGIYETALAAADYVLHPLNGIMRGVPGWPYTAIKLRPTSGRRFHLGAPSVQLTTPHWGWAAVPDPVYESCKIATSETFALKDARFGVAGFGAMGSLRVRNNPMVRQKLAPYIRHPVVAV